MAKQSRGRYKNFDGQTVRQSVEVRMTPPFQAHYDLFKPFVQIPAIVRPKPPCAIRHKFTAHEDSRLRALVAELGDANWAEVAARFGTRSPRQCRERFKNYLDPNLRQDAWSAAEDELLVQKFIELGSKWAEIGQFFDRRSEANVKNRWAQMTTKCPRGQLLDLERQDLIQRLDRIIANGNDDEGAKPEPAAPDIFADAIFWPGGSIWDTGPDGSEFDFL
jgi:hypothetical protein